jgi:hypothetical protein
MSCHVLLCVVTYCLFLSCLTFWCCVYARLAQWGQAWSRLVLSRSALILSIHIKLCLVLSYLGMTCLATSLFGLSCFGLSYLAVSGPILLCVILWSLLSCSLLGHKMPSYCYRRQLAPSAMKETFAEVKERLTREMAERTETRVKFWRRIEE